MTGPEGSDSDYKIIYGRSAEITGIHYDRSGVSLMNDGGTIFGAGLRLIPTAALNRASLSGQTQLKTGLVGPLRAIEVGAVVRCRLPAGNVLPPHCRLPRD
jgi:hypothetical protein